MVGTSPAYLHLELLEAAEKYIKDNPYKDLSVNTKKPTNTSYKIICSKGKTKKYFNSKKCPAGYKLVKKVS